MLRPKRTKYRKAHTGRIKKGVPIPGRKGVVQPLSFGDLGLVALEDGKVSARQIESSRRSLRHVRKRKGQVWIRIFPATPITSKPVSVRRGRGKGNVSYWAARVRAGMVLFEVGGEIPLAAQKAALASASNKLNVQTRIVERGSVLVEDRRDVSL